MYLNIPENYGGDFLSVCISLWAPRPLPSGIEPPLPKALLGCRILGLTSVTFPCHSEQDPYITKVETRISLKLQRDVVKLMAWSCIGPPQAFTVR